MLRKIDAHPGAIVLADPGYKDQRRPKVRPLLVVSSKTFHSDTQYALCLGITTNQNRDPYMIPIPHSEVRDGCLDHDSQVMCTRMATLRQTDLNKIATITPCLYDRILDKIKNDVMEWTLTGGRE